MTPRTAIYDRFGRTSFLVAFDFSPHESPARSVALAMHGNAASRARAPCNDVLRRARLQAGQLSPLDGSAKNCQAIGHSANRSSLLALLSGQQEFRGDR